jgi:hypothetical protein
MIVLSNTSPITNLAAIGQIDLLEKLYGNIIIPQAVYRELTIYGRTIPGAIEAETLTWIKTQKVTNTTLAESLQNQLDEGEAEAIALAIELKAEWLLMDEQLGRNAASDYGLQLTGILGILIEAKRTGLITEVKPLLDDLIAIAEFWISQSLYVRILQAVGEFPP